MRKITSQIKLIAMIATLNISATAQTPQHYAIDSVMNENECHTIVNNSIQESLLSDYNKSTPTTSPSSIYDMPYSITGRNPDWHRLWMNTATLSGAFVGTLIVLECLPEDATSWNRAELREVPLFKRWHNHVIKKGPEWDHDKFYFNYILHPYAGAVYYMTARSCGFNAWQSLLYCSCISNIGWEFGIEAFMERPSIQDLFITPLVGSAIGECFYKLKRNIVANDYSLFGSTVLGNIVAYLIDPVNEVVGLFAGNPCREKNKSVDISMAPIISPSSKSMNYGFALCYSF
ncbi:MAG: DUF3943 domain-containing protein [Paramuribaculum sp.]|nr:DUF3943 domain-containing protein [Paramuribaculum sp.]